MLDLLRRDKIRNNSRASQHEKYNNPNRGIEQLRLPLIQAIIFSSIRNYDKKEAVPKHKRLTKQPKLLKPEISIEREVKSTEITFDVLGKASRISPNRWDSRMKPHKTE